MIENAPTFHPQPAGGPATRSLPRRYQLALAECSRTLLAAAPMADDRQALLNKALSFLVPAVGAARAYILEEYTGDGNEPLLRILAEACAPGVNPHIINPANQRASWSLLPSGARARLDEGRVISGPIAEIYAARPDLIALFHGQANPLLSVLLLPLFVEDKLWGFAGFDDVTQPRRWHEDEVMLLRTASEMFASTLHRWTLEDQLRRQAAREATLAERQRMAQNLHDVITQALYALTLMARSGREALHEADYTLLAESLAGIEENAGLAQREMRLLLYQLSPLEMQPGGLEAALRDRLRRVEARLGINTTLDIQPDLSLPRPTQETLYLIATEALNNSLQHARASRVEVSLAAQGGALRLEVRDNGRGFRTERMEPGMGLAQIARRARALNAELKIDTEPGGGTSIALLLPVQARSGTDA